MDTLPNIVLIIMDAAGAKRCSAYGHERPTTPGLARLAEEGALYRHCFAPAPWTIPSHASLFSGLYPSEHGCDEKAIQLPEVYHTLPQVLGQMGYRTAAISSNGLVNLQRGFDVFFEMDSLSLSEEYHQARMTMRALKKETPGEFNRLLLQFKFAFGQGYPGFLLVNPLDRFYRRYCMSIYDKSWKATLKSMAICKNLLHKYRDRQPLFLFVNLMETHYKYNPPPEAHNIIRLSDREKKEILQFDPFGYYIERPAGGLLEKLTLLYEQELAFVDSCIADLYGYLAEAGLRDRTLFIVTSDHGEFLGEHDLYGHYFSLYNEVLHIPLVVRYPDGDGPRGEVASLVQLQDLYATILEAAGVPLPPPLSSASLLSGSRDFALAEHLNLSLGLAACQRRDPNFRPPDFMQPCRAIIDPQFLKLIEWADGRRELYDLRRDFTETTDLAVRPDRQEQAAALAAELTERLGPFPAPSQALQ